MSPFVNTPLHEAILEEEIETIRSLLDSGADPNAPNGVGRRPLGCTENRDVIALLLAHGADPNATDSIGNTALDVAVKSMTPVEVVELLLKAGADPNAIGGRMGWSTFTFACRQVADISKIKALIRGGADVNKVDLQGETPLAAAKRRPDVQSLLREAGAKV